MKSVLFLIPTLDRGGAENVLVELVNRLDQTKFKITVQTLFDENSQKDKLAPGIEYRSFLYHQFHGNSRLQAWIPAKALYQRIIKKRYDLIISYLEGPTTHILSGCPFADTKKAAWVHVEMDTTRQMSVGFRSSGEALRSYHSFDRVVFVAKTVQEKFEKTAGSAFDNACVLYNTVDSAEILKKSKTETDGLPFRKDEFNIVSVGRIIHAKGFDRLIRVQKRLLDEGIRSHVYILGTGADENNLRKRADDSHISESFTFLGFKENPYEYMAKADLFVCSSRREGFSTAVTEALILGIPVVSTNCSGAYELLGENDEFGIVTESNEEALYYGIKRLLDDPALLAHYKEKAIERGRTFSTENTVKAVEDMLLKLTEE